MTIWGRNLDTPVYARAVCPCNSRDTVWPLRVPRATRFCRSAP